MRVVSLHLIGLSNIVFSYEFDYLDAGWMSSMDSGLTRTGEHCPDRNPGFPLMLSD